MNNWADTTLDFLWDRVVQFPLFLGDKSRNPFIRGMCFIAMMVWIAPAALGFGIVLIPLAVLSLFTDYVF